MDVPDECDDKVPCQWCGSTLLEVSLGKRPESARAMPEGPHTGITRTEKDLSSTQEEERDDISIETVIFDRFKGSSKEEELALLDACSRIIGIQQPICRECSEEIVQQLMVETDDLRREGLAYESLLLKISRNKENTSIFGDEESWATLDSVAAEYEKRCVIQEQELNDLEKLKKVQEKIDTMEETYWEAFNTLNLHLHDAADLRDALQLQMDRSNYCMDTLLPTNKHIMMNILDIKTDGPFGTISGCRLGSTTEVPVQWWEINTAWGQAVLLLDIVRESLGIQFHGGNIILEPNGSYARIFERGKGYYDLHGPVNKLLCFGFDKAQTLFLQCIQEIEAELKERERIHANERFVLPYPISGDRVGGNSIRYGLSRDRVWTEALRSMLINLKQCLSGSLAFQGPQKMAARQFPVEFCRRQDIDKLEHE